MKDLENGLDYTNDIREADKRLEEYLNRNPEPIIDISLSQSESEEYDPMLDRDQPAPYERQVFGRRDH